MQRRKTKINLKKKLLSIATGLLSALSIANAGTYILPSDYENTYYSSVKLNAHGTILFGRSLNYDGITLWPYPLYYNGNNIMCYNIPKINCQNGRIPSIDTSIAATGVLLGGKWLKLNNAIAFASDNGNTWRVCGYAIGSTSEDAVWLSNCWTNSKGMCIQLNYAPDARTIRVIADYNTIMNGGAFLTVNYTQTCR